MTGCAALIVAAGRSVRHGGTIPKQYLPLAGVPMLRRSLMPFVGHEQVAAVRVVFNPVDREHYDAATEGLSLLAPVAGGDSRQESVRLGLESLRELAPDRVLIHDAARPLTGKPVVDRILAALDHAPGAVAGIPVTDTLKTVDGDRVGGTVPREHLWRAQTPQGFHYRPLVEAHGAAAGKSLTDDAAVAEAAGLEVRMVLGDETNLKVTTADDFDRAAAWLAAPGQRLVRVGAGFDVHRYGAGEAVMLCGVRIAHDRGLIGHSDGDAGLHALVDALLGAVGEGDIGHFFPSDDDRWKGAASSVFLHHAVARLAALGAEIANVDITLICQAPRIGPHREAMVARVANLLGLARERVSVKATTTDHLGFTGRGEGIAAHAVATVSVPI